MPSACVSPLPPCLSHNPSSPRCGQLKDPIRGQRKRWQVESIFHLLQRMVRALQASGKTHRIHIVDFASSSGMSSLPLAALLPDCDFTLVDIRAEALRLAARQAQAAGLTNLRTRLCPIEEFSDQAFDVGMAMHACGTLSDLVQLQCFARSASYLLCPCCTGSLRQAVDLVHCGDGAYKPFFTTKKHLTATELMTRRSHINDLALHHQLQHPHSELMRSLVTTDQYLTLVRASDYPSGRDEGHALEERFSSAKAWLEVDRQQKAREMGYQTILTKLSPLKCSPKHDVLIGMPPGTDPQVVALLLHGIVVPTEE